MKLPALLAFAGSILLASTSSFGGECPAITGKFVCGSGENAVAIKISKLTGDTPTYASEELTAMELAPPAMRVDDRSWTHDEDATLLSRTYCLGGMLTTEQTFMLQGETQARIRTDLSFRYDQMLRTALSDLDSGADPHEIFCARQVD